MRSWLAIIKYVTELNPVNNIQHFLHQTSFPHYYRALRDRNSAVINELF